MAALLVAMAVMGVMLSVALPVWQTAVQREREAELVFRGQQYVQAIELFSRRTGGLPPSLDVLESGRFLRKRYKDPITGGDFQPVYLGQVAAAVPGPPAQGGRRGQAPQAGRQTSLGPQGPAPAPSIGQATGRMTSPFGRAGQPASSMSGQVGAGAGPIIGVVSTSTAEGLRLYNGRGRYNEWLFVSTAATSQPEAPGDGVQAPQAPGRGGGIGPGRGGRGPGRGRGFDFPVPIPRAPQ